MATIKSKTTSRFYPRQLLNRLNGKKHDSLSPRDHDVLSFFLRKSRKYGVAILVAHRVVIGDEKIIHLMNDEKFYREARKPFVTSEALDAGIKI